MLARFENGYFLEVVIDREEFTYDYEIYDKDEYSVDCGWTEYRNMKSYYPMNEIDYICKFCNPEYVKGKYEILPYDTMDDYIDHIDYLKYGVEDGEWCLECQGSDREDVRFYKTEVDAKAAMIKDANEFLEKRKYCDLSEGDTCCDVYGEEYFQRWRVYEKPVHKTEIERIFNEIELNINRVYTGIDQYACELQDTYVAVCHLDTVNKLVNQLKEMIE